MSEITSPILNHPLFDKVVQKNISYYRLTFKNIHQNPTETPKFNWAAAILGPTWFAYRRLGQAALVGLMFETIIWKFSDEILPMYVKTNRLLAPELNPIGLIAAIVLLAAHIGFFGYVANKAYYDVLKEGLSVCKDEDEAIVSMSPSYGRAITIAIVGIVISILASAIQLTSR